MLRPVPRIIPGSPQFSLCEPHVCNRSKLCRSAGQLPFVGSVRVILPEIHEFLGCRTPDGWIAAALADQETLLIDHKNCEKKAAIQLRNVRNIHAA